MIETSLVWAPGASEGFGDTASAEFVGIFGAACLRFDLISPLSSAPRYRSNSCNSGKMSFSWHPTRKASHLVSRKTVSVLKSSPEEKLSEEDSEARYSSMGDRTVSMTAGSLLVSVAVVSEIRVLVRRDGASKRGCFNASSD